MQQNDIAILTLETAVEYSAKISPVCLPNPGFADSLIGENLVVMGWGSVSGSSYDPPPDLRQVTVRGFSNQVCKSIYDAAYGQYAVGSYPTVIRSMVCATAPGKDSCNVTISTTNLEVNY